MCVTDVMSGKVRPVSSLPNGQQADSCRGSCFMRSKRDAVQGWDTLVRGTISKGHFVQGAQHPRTFGRGHIGRGHINPASTKGGFLSGVFGVKITTGCGLNL
jgi:hypothetical protein